VDSNSWVDVAGVEDLPEKRGFRFAIGSDVVLLVRASDSIFAVGNQCTHQGAALDRGVVKVAGSVRTVTCPAHGSMFNLETGKPMRPPATKSVPVCDVRIEDGRVYVRLRADS
jgi:nitrite reductase/ring-hydroxylating ferredoxin subunit